MCQEGSNTVIRSYRAGRLLVVAVAALVPVLAGCEAGNQAPTQEFHYPTDSAGIRVGDVSVRNVFVLGAPIGRNVPQGDNASVFLSLINTNASKPDTLTGISAPGTARSVTLPTPGGISILAGHPVNYSGPAPRVVLHGLLHPLRSGQTVRLQLMFKNTRPVVLEAPVMARALQYATLQPPPAAAGQGGPQASPASPGASPASPGASPASPGASPASPGATPTAPGASPGATPAPTP